MVSPAPVVLYLAADAKFQRVLTGYSMCRCSSDASHAFSEKSLEELFQTLRAKLAIPPHHILHLTQLWAGERILLDDGIFLYVALLPLPNA
jgi:hypothetical protein